MSSVTPVPETTGMDGEQLSAVPSLPASPSEATAQALALLDGQVLPRSRVRRLGS